MLPNVVEAAHLQAANGVEGFMRPVFSQALGPADPAGAVIGLAAPRRAIVLVASASGGCRRGVTSVMGRSRPPPRTRRRRSRCDPGVVTDVSPNVSSVSTHTWLWATLFFATILVLATIGSDRGAGAVRPARSLPAAMPVTIPLVLMAFGARDALSSLAFASIPMPRRYLTLMLGIWGVSSVPLVAMGSRTVRGCSWSPHSCSVCFRRRWSSGAPPCSGGAAASAGPGRRVWTFVSVALLPLSMAIVTPVSHAIGYTATFVLAGLLRCRARWCSIWRPGCGATRSGIRCAMRPVPVVAPDTAVSATLALRQRAVSAIAAQVD